MKRWHAIGIAIALWSSVRRTGVKSAEADKSIERRLPARCSRDGNPAELFGAQGELLEDAMETKERVVEGCDLGPQRRRVGAGAPSAAALLQGHRQGPGRRIPRPHLHVDAPGHRREALDRRQVQHPEKDRLRRSRPTFRPVQGRRSRSPGPSGRAQVQPAASGCSTTRAGPHDFSCSTCHG